MRRKSLRSLDTSAFPGKSAAETFGSELWNYEDLKMRGSLQ